MAKIALLIGVSNYQNSFNPLPGVVQDIEAMQKVLQNPEIGGFDVRTCINCNRQEMEEAIEILFLNGQKDDLVLLYFSGHGIIDDNGALYFATYLTRKNPQGELITTTAVAAKFIDSTMTRSGSQRQVLILDCCYSGAFCQDILRKDTKDNGLVDVKKQLGGGEGGKGRAVLTSSTSTQPSFDLIYTQCLVKGMESGEADLDNDGYISVEELHNYTQQQVQKEKPEMKPEIYQIKIKESDTILLAKAPNSYERILKRFYLNGEISDMGRLILDRLRDQLNLTREEAEEREKKALEKMRKNQENLALYKNKFIDYIKSEYPLSIEAKADLKILQNILGVEDKEIAVIEKNATEQRQEKWREYEQALFQKKYNKNGRNDRNTEELIRLQQSLELTDKEVEIIKHNLTKKPPIKWPTMKKPYLLIAIVAVILSGSSGFIAFIRWSTYSDKNPVFPPKYTEVTPNVADTFWQVSNVPSGTFKYSGSGAWTPIHPKIDSEIQKVYNQFKLEFKTEDKQGKLEVGSRESIDMLLDGELDFALSNLPISDRDKNQAQQKGFALEQIPVSKNGVAVAVNPKLNISKLTIEQLRDIYTGKIRNWHEVNGSGIKINIYTSGGRINSSRDWIKSILKIENKELADLTPTTNANEAFNKVAKDPGGISLSSASLVVPQCSIKALPIVGNRNKVVPPYQQNNFVPPEQCSSGKRNRVNVEAFYSGDYPLTNDLYVVIKQNGKTEERAGRAYANLVKTKQGQKMIKQLQETGNY